MRIRITTAAVVAALALTLVGCDDNTSDSKADATAGTTVSAAPETSSAPATGAATSSAPAASSAPTPSSTPAQDSTKDAGLPPEPTGAERDAVLAALFDVDAGLVHDEDKAVDAARKQCAALDSGVANPDHAAAQQFSYDGNKLTDDAGKHINIGLRKTLCPAS
ncbi:hypothetical protein KV205_26550 [Streptomyces sp. SKN60]|uniref:hypothetical protein n=1 Tax=Streptomyces sp. SKN60 TaxID=2855506 RepID=UPI00224671AB|nr:hypothetical protein [Streptomyces sp. SKN60]MCX2184067.1 hypothetical protein [Streptomyces sp. SKN60]